LTTYNIYGVKNNNQNLDNLFREKLEGLEIAPPADTWDKIRSGLAQPEKNKRAAFFRLIAAAALVVFVLVAGWLFTREPGNNLPVAVNKQDAGSGIKLPEQQPARELVFDDSEVDKKVNVVVEKSSRPITLAQQPNKISSGEAIPVRGNSGSFRLLAQARQLLPAFEIKEKLRESSKNKVVFADRLTPGEKALVALNSSFQNKKNQKIRSWEVGVKVSPGYGSQQASHDAEYASSMTYSNTSGKPDLSAGVSATYKPGKKWSMETGVYYARNGQSSDNSIYATSEQDYSAAPASYFNTPVMIKRGQIAMNSTAGVIKFSKTPVNSELSATLDGNGLSTSSLLTGGEFSQVFDFVEVPLYLRYTLLDSKIDVHLMGGFSTNFLVGNNVYMSGSFGKENVGKTADISQVNFSGAIGAGIDYTLGKHLSVSIEPRLNYYLNSINKNRAVNYHPYRIGIYTGLNYEF